MTTPQEQAWQGDFGNAYHGRAPGNEESNYHFFVRALERVRMHDFVQITSALELGSGTGSNLRALQRMSQAIAPYGVEINAEAIVTSLKRQPVEGFTPEIWRGSVLDFKPQHLEHQD